MENLKSKRPSLHSVSVLLYIVVDTDIRFLGSNVDGIVEKFLFLIDCHFESHKLNHDTNNCEPNMQPHKKDACWLCSKACFLLIDINHYWVDLTAQTMDKMTDLASKMGTRFSLDGSSDIDLWLGGELVTPSLRNLLDR